MNVIIIGAGASGVTAAINYKRNHKNDDVLIIEHLDKPLKKILATGNGKCNLGNTNIDINKYQNSEFVKNIINNYSYKEFFNSIHIVTKNIDGLLYPISESAVSVREALLNELNDLQIDINLNEQIIDYKVGERITVITNIKSYICDKLYLAGGLLSSPKLGSDGSLINILIKHNYNVIDVYPGLSPIITKEKTKILDGLRIKCKVSLFSNDKICHEENGEVLFKEHGLSGIVIFNTMSLISRKPKNCYRISLDLLPDYSQKEIEQFYVQNGLKKLLLAYINPKLHKYLIERFKEDKKILKALKDLSFEYKESMGFDFSQVSIGGIDINDVNDCLMSKLEKNVFIIGELLNVDGPCGGYNLTWAFASSIKSTK